METQQCKKCGRVLPLSGFNRNKNCSNGHLTTCRECQRVLIREWRLTHKEHMQTTARAYYRSNRETILRYTKDRAESHPEQRAAVNKVNHAIRDGRLTRQPCEVCGMEAEAHHDDYTKPLDVRWLCSIHHKRLHVELRGKLVNVQQ